MSAAPLLDIRDLRIGFQTMQGLGIAVNGVSFHLDAGETLAVVGESGCGKSVTALSILRLLPMPPARLLGGEVWFGGRNLIGLPAAEMRAIRGREIAMIFQEPMTSLNPVLTIGRQVAEAIRVHERVSARQARERAIELLDWVRLPDVRKRIYDHPHRLSGGMRQRVMIAMAIACNPRLLIADEPTTALDVTVQAQILELLKSLQRRLGMALMLITHNLGVVAETADRVVVMYAGRVVETGRVREVLKEPRHPYTRMLLEATPRPPTASAEDRFELREIPGVVPSMFDLPMGCAFAPRCPQRMAICDTQIPAAQALGPTRAAACFASAPPGAEAA